MQLDVDKPIVKKLLDFFGDKYERMPQIYAFQYRNAPRQFFKARYQQNHNYIIYCELVLWISNILEAPSQDQHAHHRSVQPDLDPGEAQFIARWNKRKNVIQSVNLQVMHNVLGPLYQQMNGKKAFILLLYAASYCRDCIEISVLVDQLAEEYEKFDAAYKLYFTRIALD